MKIGKIILASNGPHRRGGVKKASLAFGFLSCCLVIALTVSGQAYITEVIKSTPTPHIPFEPKIAKVNSFIDELDKNGYKYLTSATDIRRPYHDDENCLIHAYYHQRRLVKVERKPCGGKGIWNNPVLQEAFFCDGNSLWAIRRGDEVFYIRGRRQFEKRGKGYTKLGEYTINDFLKMYEKYFEEPVD